MLAKKNSQVIFDASFVIGGMVFRRPEQGGRGRDLPTLHPEQQCWLYPGRIAAPIRNMANVLNERPK
jgi:hypothetical protein